MLTGNVEFYVSTLIQQITQDVCLKPWHEKSIPLSLFCFVVQRSCDSDVFLKWSSFVCFWFFPVVSTVKSMICGKRELKEYRNPSRFISKTHKTSIILIKAFQRSVERKGDTSDSVCSLLWDYLCTLTAKHGSQCTVTCCRLRSCKCSHAFLIPPALLSASWKRRVTPKKLAATPCLPPSSPPWWISKHIEPGRDAVGEIPSWRREALLSSGRNAVYSRMVLRLAFCELY